MAKASASSSRLLNRNVASRETTDSSRCSLRSSGSRHTISAVATASTTAMNASRIDADARTATKAWIEPTTPLRVRNVPNSASAKVAVTSTMFQTFSMPFFSCTITECRKAVAASQGISAAFSTGSQAQ